MSFSREPRRLNRIHESDQPRTELFLLGPGEKKVTMELDTRIASSAIFHFHKEDHTLANMLRSRLLKTAHVTFAAYKVPHPLVAEFELRVQTDGEVTPKETVVQACRDLVQELAELSRQFTKEWELRKIAGVGARPAPRAGTSAGTTTGTATGTGAAAGPAAGQSGGQNGGMPERG